MQLTREQSAIVNAPAGNMLVSAAAGSGKTAVLTDRIVRRLVAGEIEIRNILVMTFTEAAARNMRDKIEQKLRSSLASQTEPARCQLIARQIALLPGAAISTIHSFCLDVIRNFYSCALDENEQPLIEPGFSVDDGVEAELLLRKTLDEWMSDQYESIDLSSGDHPVNGFDDQRQAAFYRLVEGYGSNGSDLPLRELMLHLHQFLRSLPDYASQVKLWLTDLEAASRNFSEGRHLEALLRQLLLLLDKARDPLDEMSDLLGSGIRFIRQAERNLFFHEQFGRMIERLRQLDRYLLQGGRDWDTIRTISDDLHNLDLPRGHSADSLEKQAFMTLFARHVSEVIHCLTGQCGTAKYTAHFIFQTRHLFSLSKAQIQADITEMMPSVRLLFELILGLDHHYANSKQAAGLIDFSDFEHLALAILRQTEAGQYYRGRFKEIYVDEYQDTSKIQEAIIEAISDGCCLMVGDIKQSIYRFRHASPGIFIERAASFRLGQKGILHELNQNFRSVAGILAAVNELFGQIMSTGAGEIDYDQQHALVATRPRSASEAPPVSLLLLNRQQPETPAMEPDDSSDEPEPQSDDLNRYQQEALAVADRILSLRAAGRSFSEMVILARTRSIGQACREQLENFQIPVLSDHNQDFFDSPALRQMEAMLRLLDNLRQDIPLAAVLRSEIWQGGFSDEELIRIRLFGRSQMPKLAVFHEAVVLYAAEGPDMALRQRLAGCLDWLADLRRREQLLSLGELIGLVFDESGWMERLAAQPGDKGLKDRQKLRQFRQWAEQFEVRRPRGLHAFISHLDSLRRRGIVESPVPVSESKEDAVRIMTIHGCKGLEFPVVFLVGTGYDLTPKEKSDCLLISETLGIGMDYADADRQIRYPTHLKLAMQEELKAASLAEELRLLYVAMTRAMDQLIIVGSLRIGAGQAEKRLAFLAEQAGDCAGSQLPAYLVLSGRSYLDWLVMALARQKDLDLDFLGGGEFPTGELDLPAWHLEFMQLMQLKQRLAEKQFIIAPRAENAPSCDPAALLQLIIDLPSDPDAAENDLNLLMQRRLAEPYRYEGASRLPMKLTVSELKRLEQSIEPEEKPRGIGMVFDQWAEDESGTTGGRTGPAPAELGLLLHDFFRYLDLEAARQRQDLAEISRQLEAMGAAGIFSQDQISALYSWRTRLLAFVQSGLAAEMVLAQKQSAGRYFAEMPFTLVLPACEVHPDCAGLASEDKVLVQGIIDCWFESEDGIVLVDYKSDHLPADRETCRNELVNRYGLQLKYYARAIEAATGQTVSRRLVWLIRQAQALELPDN